MNRQNRLRSSREFKRLFSAGKRAVSGPILCVAKPGDDGEVTKVGFVVTRKVGGAVERNHVKRLLRESARHLIGRIKPGSQVILMARGPMPDRNFQHITRAVETAMGKAGVL